MLAIEIRDFATATEPVSFEPWHTHIISTQRSIAAIADDPLLDPFMNILRDMAKAREWLGIPDGYAIKYPSASQP